MTDFADKPMTFAGAKRYLDQKASLPTAMSSAEISLKLPARIRGQAFVSAKVSSANILEKLRAEVDLVASGKIGYSQARERLKVFLAKQGVGIAPPGSKDDKDIEALGSTSRLNLILRQNVAMAHAVGQREVAENPAVMEYFPNYEYLAETDGKTRAGHAKFNGLVLPKTDPFWDTHFPPWEFNCRCMALDTDAPANGKTAGWTTTPEGAQIGRVDYNGPQNVLPNQSGFVFASNPKDAFAEPNFASIEDPAVRGAVESAWKDYAARTRLKAETPQTEAEKPKVFASAEVPLLVEERDAIHDWSSPLFDDIVNAQKGLPTNKIAEAEALQKLDLIRSAISKLPAFKGTTFRGLSFDTAEKKAAFLASLVANRIVHWNHLSASSKLETVAKRYSNKLGHGVMFIIEGESGRDIHKWTKKPFEQEVLLPENTALVIDKIDGNRIFVREVRVK